MSNSTHEITIDPEEQSFADSSPKKEYVPDLSLTISNDDELPTSEHPSFNEYTEENEEDLQDNYRTMMIMVYALYIIKAFICLLWAIVPYFCHKRQFCFGERRSRGEYDLSYLGFYGGVVFGSYFLTMVLLKKISIFNNTAFYFFLYTADFCLSFILYHTLLYQAYLWDRKRKAYHKELRATGLNFYLIVQLIACSLFAIMHLMSGLRVKKRVMFMIYFGLSAALGYYIVPRRAKLKNIAGLYSLNFVSAFFVSYLMIKGDYHLKRYMVNPSRPFGIKDVFYYATCLRFETTFALWGDLIKYFRSLGIDAGVQE